MTMPAARFAPRPRQPRRGRRGFSFVEVLFAVMILGLGFIMIAGIFPAALTQTAATQEETVAAQVVRGAVSVMAEMPYKDAVVPYDSRRMGLENKRNDVVRLTDEQVDLFAPKTVPPPMGTPPVAYAPPYAAAPANPAVIKPWSLIKHSQILPENPRFAWIPLLQRQPANLNGEAPRQARVVVVAVQVRGRDQFTAADQTMYPPVPPNSYDVDKSVGTLMPLYVKVNVKEGVNDPDVIRFDASDPRNNNRFAAAPGAVVVIASGTDKSNRSAAGRIYRLGNPVVEGGVNAFELLPGSDMLIDPGPNGELEPIPGTGDDRTEDTALSDTTYHDAYLVGQALKEPYPADMDDVAQFGGGSMVTGVYSSYIPVR